MIQKGLLKPLFFVLFLCILHPAQGQLFKKKAKKKPPTEKSASKKDIQPYEKVITKKAKSDDGLFTVHDVDGKFFYEIPDSLFNREM